MRYRPDIVAILKDRPEVQLVVEVKGDHADMGAALDQVKEYMRGLNIPLGLVVNPHRLVFLHDLYDAQDLSSIRVAADVESEASDWLAKYWPTIERLGTDSPQGHSFLEMAIQRWLEDLANGAGLSGLPPHVAREAERWIKPSLVGSEVRAAYPRGQSLGA